MLDLRLDPHMQAHGMPERKVFARTGLRIIVPDLQ
jgi:hypothetical protein